MKNVTDENIGLRSEKVQKLIGEIPNKLVWFGTAAIVLMFIALFAVLCLMPYPYSNGESILMHLLGLQ